MSNTPHLDDWLKRRKEKSVALIGERDLHDKLKMAVMHDFNNLYVREFTTDWETQRKIRQLELDVMSLERLELAVSKLIASAVQAARKERND